MIVFLGKSAHLQWPCSERRLRLPASLELAELGSGKGRAGCDSAETAKEAEGFKQLGSLDRFGFFGSAEL